MARTRKSTQGSTPTVADGSRVRIQVRNTIAWPEFEGSERHRKHRSYVTRTLEGVETAKDGTVTGQARIGSHTYLVMQNPILSEKFVPADIVDTVVF